MDPSLADLIQKPLHEDAGAGPRLAAHEGLAQDLPGRRVGAGGQRMAGRRHEDMRVLARLIRVHSRFQRWAAYDREVYGPRFQRRDVVPAIPNLQPDFKIRQGLARPHHQSGSEIFAPC
jgi:hypothetical protein